MSKDSSSNKSKSTDDEQHHAVPSSVQTDITQSMIAKAAYFKAEKRNFVQGYELQDWIEAEHELHNAIEKQDTD